jgi:rSAM/selenodomain-associated transferase 1
VDAPSDVGVTGDALIVFVKAPRPGSVKTRLVPVLGAEGAAAFYRILAEEEVRRTAPRAGDYTRRLFFAPADARDAITAWFPDEVLVPQQGADLGARMGAAFEESFRSGARRVAIIGTDVPTVSRELVLDAFRALGDHDVVLGPARDGGYYLLALARPCTEIFRGIPWSTADVLSATVAKARALGLSVKALETLTDIDTLEDVRTVWAAVEPILSGAPALAAALSRALGKD